jgi:murein tripeptide amidase MpaA
MFEYNIFDLQYTVHTFNEKIWALGSEKKAKTYIFFTKTACTFLRNCINLYRDQQKKLQNSLNLEGPTDVFFIG